MAGLEVDRDAVLAGDRTVLVAVDDGRVLAALVLDGDWIDAIAVRPGRQGQRIGTALVEAAAERRDRLVAAFDDHLRPFYEGCGFEIERIDEDDDRYRGVRLP